MYKSQPYHSTSITSACTFRKQYIIVSSLTALEFYNIYLKRLNGHGCCNKLLLLY